MDDFLLTLGALTLGGSAAILLLSLASRSTPCCPKGSVKPPLSSSPLFLIPLSTNRALAAENNLPLKVRAGRRPARPAVRGARFLLPTPAVSRTHPGMSLSPCPSPNWLGHCGWEE